MQENLGSDTPRDADAKPGAVIFTHSLLEGSNTFIKSHAEALARYRPIYAGAHRVRGMSLPEDRTFVVNDGSFLGWVREAMFRQFGVAPRLINALRREHVGVVHAHFGTSGPAGLAMARPLDVPLVVTFHGHDATMTEHEARKTHRGRELIRKKSTLIDGTAAFIAVSGYIRERLLEQGYPESKVLLHRNGIDLDYYSRTGDVPREPVVLFVGRFVEKKGARYLIEAAKLLKDTGVEFELVLIGNGPLEEGLKDAAARAGIQCRFTGFLPVAEVRHWLERARVVAVPSVIASDGDSEGLPTVLLEAQAMEVPIVATRHSGIPEGVQEGVTAELVDERDVRGLAESLRGFLSSAEKAESFGRAGRRFVAENFDLRKQVAGLEELYDRLRSSGRGGSRLRRTA